MGAAAAALVMSHRAKSCGVLAVAVLAFAGGCTVRSVPISSGSEAQLRARAISGDKLGFQILPGGQKYRIQLFRADLPKHPVEVPMDRSVAGLPTIQMGLNGGKPVRFIADTGAQLSVVESGTALSGKADVYAPADGTLRVQGIGGEEPAWLARFSSAKLGEIEFNNLVTIVRRETSAMRCAGVQVGGFAVNLLGAPVLSAFSFVSFDYRAKRMMFSGSTPFVPSRGAVRVPMEMRDSLPYVPVQINGRTYSALVDTGARDQLFINEQIVRELGLEANASAGGTFKAAGLGGMIRGRTFRLPVIHIGGMPVPDVLVDSSGGPWKVRIGSELLERWRTTFDFRNRALWLEMPAL
jgi:predicted aspartyl protease